MKKAFTIAGIALAGAAGAAQPSHAESVIVQQGGGRITVIENGRTVYDQETTGGTHVYRSRGAEPGPDAQAFDEPFPGEERGRGPGAPDPAFEDPAFDEPREKDRPFHRWGRHAEEFASVEPDYFDEFSDYDPLFDDGAGSGAFQDHAYGDPLFEGGPYYRGQRPRHYGWGHDAWRDRAYMPERLERARARIDAMRDRAYRRFGRWDD